MKKIKSILKYPGSKWRIAQWIISYFPKHQVYLEPFFGSGACFFNKEPSYIETINDLDGNIVNLFKVCRDFPEELSAAINLTPFSREEFINCYQSSDNPIENARRTLVRFHQSFGTSNSTKNSWRNVQTYGGPRCATMWNDLPETITEVCKRLKNAQIENTDALLLIERYNSSDTLIYCDPPYLQTLRKRGLYKFEFSDDLHVQLLNLLKNSNSKIILSGYDNQLYNSTLKDWCTAEKTTVAQMGLHRIEKIWFNFEANQERFF